MVRPIQKTNDTMIVLTEFSLSYSNSVNSKKDWKDAQAAHTFYACLYFYQENYSSPFFKILHYQVTSHYVHRSHSIRKLNMDTEIAGDHSGFSTDVTS